MSETPKKASSKPTNSPPQKSEKASGGREARYHYHQNRLANTVVVHDEIDIAGTQVPLDLKKNEFKDREAMHKAVLAWLSASDHKFDEVAATKHCN
tara:strand:- start:271 stop:558 length:288 start_codon:yes stop_codon:yes gene_type:complete